MLIDSRTIASCLVLAALAGGLARADDAGIDFFEKKIRPVLVERCYKCHSAESDSVKGGLRLDSRDAIRRGGDSGAAVVPSQPDQSELLKAIRYEEFEMPPDGRLSAEVVSDFERWIQMGAPDPREEAVSQPITRQIDWEHARDFWSFQAPVRHVPPAVQDRTWLRQPLDAFVLSKLEANSLAPNPSADRRTLIRRVTLDLIGLPPTVEEVEAFVNDDAPLAYERLVDRLLASPQYGERWARMWLDVARYAEDQAHIVGDDNSLCYPNAYLYRDWVIAALNGDLPYDEFVRQQLAADLLQPDHRESHVALGFLGLGPKYYRRNAPEVMADEWEDRVDIVGRGLLGLTVACARCHDHKFDPIPTGDYYALAGVFASTEMFNRPLDDKRELGKNGQAKKPEDSIHIVRDIEPQDLKIHVRGDVTKPGPLAKRRFLQVLSDAEPAAFQNGSGRRELAESIVDRGNPLTARVIVNRIWALQFGRPLVDTPSNFGSLGATPSHPELLDDLAVRFMDAGWSLKWLQREIVLSATYQQSSEIDATKQAMDPANQWLWRMNRRRLSVEAWRDALLAVSGRLQSQVGGTSIKPQQPDERRRTVYSYISRLELDKMLAMFDFPDPNVHSEQRNQTTTPLQKLFVLNNSFVVQQAEALANRVRSISGDEVQRIDVAYRTLFARPPTDDELQLGLTFLADGDRWSEYAQVLLVSNELLIVD